MSFLNKVKAAIQRFMVGRNGADDFSFALLITALMLSILSSVVGSSILSLLSMAAYIYCIFRMFSRNVSKRYSENQRFVEWKRKSTTSVSQAWVRAKNFRKYKYFKCPECHALLRLPRKVGEVTVTCGKCRHAFKKSA